MARIEYFRPPQTWVEAFARNPGFVTNTQDFGDSALFRFSGPVDFFVEIDDRTSTSAVLTKIEFRTTGGTTLGVLDQIRIPFDENTTNFGSISFDTLTTIGTNRSDIFRELTPSEQADFFLFVLDGTLDARGGHDTLDLRNTFIDTAQEFDDAVASVARANGGGIRISGTDNTTLTLKNVEQVILNERSFTPEDLLQQGRLTPTNGADVIRGNGQNNRLNGLAGDDVVDGSRGDDTLIGGRGADELRGGPGSDMASYANANGSVFVHLGVGIGRGAHGPDSLSGIENVTGSRFADHLIGSDRNNRIDGGDGDDFLNGRQGPDHLDGGDGADAVAFNRAPSGVFVHLAAGMARGGDGADTIRSVEKMLGSRFDDTLIGSGEGNVIRGRFGDDTIRGRAGDDVLFGGEGDEIFVFGHNHGSDVIADFQTGSGSPDRIDLSGVTGLDTFNDVLNATDDSSGRVVISTGNGSEIRLPGVVASDLAASDFIF